MSWEPDRRSNDKMDINEAVGKLLENFNYDTIAPQPSKGGGCPRRSHVKRPMNAFMVFAQAMRRRLSEQRPSLHNAELSKSLGSMWKRLSEEQKLPFIKRSDQLRMLHKKEYPDYKYQPRRRKPQHPNTTRLKREPSPEREPMDLLRMPDFSPAADSLLPDGPPDHAEMDQYLSETDYHELQPRLPAHSLLHHPPPLYAPMPPHVHDYYAGHYSGHP